VFKTDCGLAGNSLFTCDIDGIKDSRRRPYHGHAKQNRLLREGNTGRLIPEGKVGQLAKVLKWKVPHALDLGGATGIF